MELGAFSISLTVKNLEASKKVLREVWVQAFAGDASKNWLIDGPCQLDCGGPRRQSDSVRSPRLSWPAAL